MGLEVRGSSTAQHAKSLTGHRSTKAVYPGTSKCASQGCRAPREMRLGAAGVGNMIRLATSWSPPASDTFSPLLCTFPPCGNSPPPRPPLTLRCLCSSLSPHINCLLTLSYTLFSSADSQGKSAQLKFQHCGQKQADVSSGPA